MRFCLENVAENDARKTNICSGSVTVFISLCLSTFIMLILTMISLALDNDRKVRFEGITDIAMNSVLGEYSVELFEEYGLLYIDASYLEMNPSVENIKSRIESYYLENVGGMNRVFLNSVDILKVQTAAARNGESLRSQIGQYMKVEELWGIGMPESYHEELSSLLDIDVLGDFESLMESLDGMDRPKLENPETGILEEVSLDNPAEEAFSKIGCDILYLIDADLSKLSNVDIDIQNLPSHRSISNQEALGNFEHIDNIVFSKYLFSKMGRYRKPKDHVLTCECEYVICGEESDFKNLGSVAGRIFSLTLAQNYLKDQSDSELIAGAYLTAAALTVCALSPEFIEPVAKTIIYAHTFNESVKDMQKIMNGDSSRFGLTYDDFLIFFLVITDEKTMNMRTMDIIENQIGNSTRNPNFRMDYCVERIMVNIKGGPGDYNINRTYGYY